MYTVPYTNGVPTVSSIYVITEVKSNSKLSFSEVKSFHTLSISGNLYSVVSNIQHYHLSDNTFKEQMLFGIGIKSFQYTKNKIHDKGMTKSYWV